MNQNISATDKGNIICTFLLWLYTQNIELHNTKSNEICTNSNELINNFCSQNNAKMSGRKGGELWK